MFEILKSNKKLLAVHIIAAVIVVGVVVWLGCWIWNLRDELIIVDQDMSSLSEKYDNLRVQNNAYSEKLQGEIADKNDEIKNAYIKLVKIHHPDHGGNSEMYQQITKAYESLLSNN